MYNINFNEPEVLTYLDKKKRKKSNWHETKACTSAETEEEACCIEEPPLSTRNSLLSKTSKHKKTQRICRENKNMYNKLYICSWFRLVLFLFKKKNYILLKIILCIWLFFTWLKQLSKTWCQGMLEVVGKWGGSTFSGFGVLFIHSHWFLSIQVLVINKEIWKGHGELQNFFN